MCPNTRSYRIEDVDNSISASLVANNRWSIHRMLSYVMWCLVELHSVFAPPHVWHQRRMSYRMSYDEWYDRANVAWWWLTVMEAEPSCVGYGVALITVVVRLLPVPHSMYSKCCYFNYGDVSPKWHKLVVLLCFMLAYCPSRQLDLQCR